MVSARATVTRRPRACCHRHAAEPSPAQLGHDDCVTVSFARPAPATADAHRAKSPRTAPWPTVYSNGENGQTYTGTLETCTAEMNADAFALTGVVNDTGRV